ncbi:BMC domain-containing protein [Photobacterium ganghwense]|uniref:BMC domain-containing protein n=1 Tax=Photobacterium ganghwense TaxID=320778 RepID=UPI00069F85C0|nr:BMC domain-containing protein [Photobacterium ganghwense]PSU08043.1 BMC domain-containing protein [Photobacterium ganghwense]
MTISLGVIETIGLTAAIHAADAACKAAGVSLTGYRKVGSGLVSIYLQGEISAVKVAVDSGVKAIVNQTDVTAAIVMARPDPSVLAMLENAGGCVTEAESLSSSVTPETDLPGEDVLIQMPEAQAAEHLAQMAQEAGTQNAEFQGQASKEPLDASKVDTVEAVKMASPVSALASTHAKVTTSRSTSTRQKKSAGQVSSRGGKS